MLDPSTILVASPCYDGRNVSELTGALVMCGGLFGALSLPTECSHVSLVRNLIAANFMANPQLEWLIGIDNDTAPSRKDMELLLEPIDVTARYLHPDDGSQDEDSTLSHERQQWAPLPTRIQCPQWTDHEHRLSGKPKVLAPADALVVSEYSYKNDTLQPVKLGMGFVRIHRSVFETLQELKHDGGPTIEVRRDLFEELRQLNACGNDTPMGRTSEEKADAAIRWHDRREALIKEILATAEDKAGQPRLWQTSYQGRVFYDFFPSGPLISQFVPTGEWKGEDHGFFTLCYLAGIIPRKETRTRLVHIGRKGYPYFGPDTGAGQ